MEALATKYRPSTLEEIVGQNSVSAIIQKQIAEHKIRNCYLFAGPSGCVDRDTEYFNGTTWKKIADYTGGEKVLQFDPVTRTASLVTPVDYLKFPCSEFNYFHTKYGVDMMLCDDHTVVYEHKEKIYTIRCADLVSRQRKARYGFSGRLLTTFNYSGSGIDLTDSEIRLMCAVICDGTFKSDCATSRCFVHLKKSRKIEELHQILKDCKIDYKTTAKQNGYTLFSFIAPRKEKAFSSYWYNCSAHQLQVIVDNILKWGGCESKHKTFHQKNKDTIDFIQFAFASCGYRTSIREDVRKGRTLTRIVGGQSKVYTYGTECNYTLVITAKHSATVGFGKSPVDSVSSVDGFKYCFTVPTHQWVMRRNGHIIITGNCGKTTTARALAKAINGSLAGIIEIDAASNNGVENVRSIVASASERAIGAEYKVYIIDECQSLGSAAWTAFLKCLEEPPAYTIFMFCTTNPEKIPATILNRLQRYNLQRIPWDKIRDRLMYICSQEQFINYQAACEYIAKISKGQMRDAIANLDKCASYSTDLNLDNVLYCLGNYSYDSFFALTDALVDDNEPAVLQTVNDFYFDGKDLHLFISTYFDFIADVCKYLIFKSFDLISIPESMQSKLDFTVGFEGADKFFKYYMNSLLALKNEIKDDPNPKTTIEVLLLQMARYTPEV